MRSSVDVHNFLLERDVPHEVIPLRGRLRSPERLAAFLDLSPNEVGKVQVFEWQGGGVAAVVPSGRSADPARVREAAGRPDIIPATDERAAELTGYLPESIPPVGLPPNLSVVLDRSMATDAVLYFPGGEARAVLKIRGTDLERATGAIVAGIASPEGSDHPRGPGR